MSYEVYEAIRNSIIDDSVDREIDYIVQEVRAKVVQAWAAKSNGKKLTSEEERTVEMAAREAALQYKGEAREAGLAAAQAKIASISLNNYGNKSVIEVSIERPVIDAVNAIFTAKKDTISEAAELAAPLLAAGWGSQALRASAASSPAPAASRVSPAPPAPPAQVVKLDFKMPKQSQLKPDAKVSLQSIVGSEVIVQQGIGVLASLVNNSEKEKASRNGALNDLQALWQVIALQVKELVGLDAISKKPMGAGVKKHICKKIPSKIQALVEELEDVNEVARKYSVNAAFPPGPRTGQNEFTNQLKEILRAGQQLHSVVQSYQQQGPQQSASASVAPSVLGKPL